jgi:hypothetical protein
MQQLQITGARIAIDLGIFDAINESEAPLSVVQLAAKTGAAPELLGKKTEIRLPASLETDHVQVVSYGIWPLKVRLKKQARTTSAQALLPQCSRIKTTKEEFIICKNFLEYSTNVQL